MLLDFHGLNAKYESNWKSYFDDVVEPGETYDPGCIYSSSPPCIYASPEIHSGIWWYRPNTFDKNDSDVEWGLYPIKFTDGDSDCLNHGFTASFHNDPGDLNNYGKIKNIYAMTFGLCHIDGLTIAPGAPGFPHGDPQLLFAY